LSASAARLLCLEALAVPAAAVPRPDAGYRPMHSYSEPSAPSESLPPKVESVRRLLLIGAAVLMLCVLVCAQSKARKSEDAAAPRELAGSIVDKSGQAVPGAVVFLKNTRNLAVSTYITAEDGAYHFNNLSPDVDYQVRAESGDHKTETRTLSSFDARKQPRINLKLGK
jgi:Carboxypeptidase regulatory-like domain